MSARDSSWARLRNQRARLCAVALALLIAAAACGGKGGAAKTGQQPRTVTIANQPGLTASAPLIVVKQKKWLSEKLPQYTIKWTDLTSTSVIREAMLAGHVQIGVNGIQPFLVGWGNGFDAKVVTTLSTENIALVAKKERYQTLADFEKYGGKIAMPAPDTIQAITLRKASLEKLGDAHALDKQFVSMDHPTAYQMFITGQIAGDMQSPPWISKELRHGGRIILGAKSVFGSQMPVVLSARQGFYDKNTKLIKTLDKQIQRAKELVRKKPREVASLLAKEFGGEESTDFYGKSLEDESLNFQVDCLGEFTSQLAQFSHKIGIMQETPDSLKEITFPTAQVCK